MKEGSSRQSLTVFCILDFYDTTGLFYDDQLFYRAYQVEHESYVDVIGPKKAEPSTSQKLKTYTTSMSKMAFFYLVSTGTNEVICYNTKGQLRKTFKYPGEGDSCHINCIGKIDNKVTLSSFGNLRNSETGPAARAETGDL